MSKEHEVRTIVIVYWSTEVESADFRKNSLYTFYKVGKMCKASSHIARVWSKN